MSGSVSPSRSCLLSRVAVVALLAGLAAGCSGAVERFGDPIYTGGTANQRDILGAAPRQPGYDEIAAAPAPATPTRQRVVAASPLPPVGASSQPLYTSSVGTQPSAQPAQPPMPAALPSVSAAPQSAPAASRAPQAGNAPRSYGGWTSAGGTRVTLERGETIDSAAKRYGVPARAIMRVNGIENRSAVREGSQIIIPTYVYDAGRVTGQRAAASSAPAAPVRVASTEAIVPEAKPRTARAVSYAPTAAEADPSGAAITAQRPPRKPETYAAAPQRSVSPAAPEIRDPQPREIARAPQPDTTVTASINPDPEPAVSSGESETRFRWPVRGRIISSFGTKPGGTKNDGINLAVPEGTAVRAVESGTVIYAGNELKGYGNLVLIRHDDGWVSAYAHNSALDVRRGDTVRRGDVVAKAGSTGTVTQPQLHFELRRGNKPVDPINYLSKV